MRANGRVHFGRECLDRNPGLCRRRRCPQNDGIDHVLFNETSMGIRLGASLLLLLSASTLSLTDACAERKFIGPSI